MLPGNCERNGWREIERKLSEVNTRAVSRRQNKLVGKFKMAVGDMVCIRKQVMFILYPDTFVVFVEKKAIPY